MSNIKKINSIKFDTSNNKLKIKKNNVTTRLFLIQCNLIFCNENFNL